MKTIKSRTEKWKISKNLKRNEQHTESERERREEKKWRECFLCS